MLRIWGLAMTVAVGVVAEIMVPLPSQNRVAVFGG